MNYKISQKIEIIYFVGVTLIFLILPTIIVWLKLSPSDFYYFWLAVSVILSIFFWVKMLEAEIEVLNFLLSDSAPCNNIIWKSEDFDKFIGPEMMELYVDSCNLFTDHQNHHALSIYTDYSFLLLPMAKIYEGVLKKILVEIQLVDVNVFKSDPGKSIGNYFNPLGNNKICDLLKDKSRDKAVPHVIYSTYQECRNHILHHDLHRDNRINTFEEAEFYRQRIEDAIEKAYNTFII